MAKTPDFKRPTTPPPPLNPQPVTMPQNVRAQMPSLDPNGPPLRRGEAAPTDWTRQQLYKLGWKDGDPIPGDFANRIAEVQREIEDERAGAKHDLPPDFKPPRMKLVNIDDLPPEKQAEMRQYLTDYKVQLQEQAQQAVRDAELDAKYANAGPGVREAAAVAAEATARYAAQRGGGIIDDRLPVATQPVQPQVKLPEDRQYGGAQGISPAFGKLEQAQAAYQASLHPQPAPTPAAPAPAQEESPTGAAPTVTHCPRCEWPVDKAFTADPTDHDILVFKAAMLDPSGKARFRKEYRLMDGAFRIRFRGLTNQETRMLKQQLRYDVLAGKIYGDGEFFAEMMEYRLCLSTEQLSMDAETVDIPPIDEIGYDPPPAGSPPETPLAKLREWFHKEVCPSESLIRVLRVQHHEFQRTTEYLETKSATDPNFSKGIAPQR